MVFTFTEKLVCGAKKLDFYFNIDIKIYFCIRKVL